MYRLFFILVFCAITFAGIGQEDSLNVTFGEVSLHDLEMQFYENDSSADALILLDKGEIGYDAKENLIFFEYHAQIKIFNKQAFYLADLTLPYSIEKGVEFEAITHELVGGEIKKTIVSDDEIRGDKLNDDIYTKQISFPGVVEGVIIEYRYKVFGNSPLEFLPWYFQTTLPVKYSEFKLNIPGGYSLKPRLYGYNELSEYDDGVKYDAWHTLKMLDVPAFVEEPYVNKIDDHYSKVVFEYESFFAETWKGLNELLLSLKGFGETIDKTNRINKFYPSDKKWAENKETLKSIHEYVSGNFKWNGEFGLSFSDKPKTLWKNGAGSSADINLLLLMFLKKAGLTAEPVFFSTIDHGLVNQDFINYQQFNNLAVYVSLGEEEFLLDATSKLRPFNVLPDIYINGNGLRVREGEPEWVSMSVNKEVAIQSTTTSYMIDLENDIISGSARVTSIGALAANSRIVFKDLDPIEVSENIESIFGEMEVDSVILAGLDDAYSNLNISFNYEIESWVEPIGQKIFFSPVVFKEIDQNPFKLAERTLPIDFTMPISNKYIFDITIPAGYEVEEMPKPVTYSLPNSDGGYTYQIEKTNTGVRVLIRFGIKKIFFAPKEYTSLREVFNLIIAKQEEKIVLRRK